LKTDTEEKRNFIHALYISLFFVAILWAIKGFEYLAGISLGNLGIYPKTFEGLKGILFSPLIHADLYHLFSNSIPVLVLTTALFYFYKPVAVEIIVLLWLVTGLCVWICGRSAYHIGASGLIYGEASFLFLSGLLRKNVRLTAISLLVIFLYGGMVWGILPFFPEISWESHLFGGLSGFTFAIIYKDVKTFDEKRAFIEEDEEDDEDENFDPGEPED
jgi:membrane associated rhomboid family serine protease